LSDTVVKVSVSINDTGSTAVVSVRRSWGGSAETAPHSGRAVLCA
jgi:hypothetical protein